MLKKGTLHKIQQLYLQIYFCDLVLKQVTKYDIINFEYFDETRECNVYFPTYYPDGDYHFFFDKNFEIGLFGHPWLREVFVLGEKLIQKFDSNKNNLRIVEIKE